MLAVVELCWSGNVICAAKIRLCRPCQFFHFQPPSESSWRSRRVCGASGPLRGVGEANRIALSRARAAVRPTVQAPRRVPGHPRGHAWLRPSVRATTRLLSFRPAIVRRAARTAARLARVGQPEPALPVSLLGLLARWIVRTVGNQGVWRTLAQMRAFPTLRTPFLWQNEGGVFLMQKKTKKKRYHVTGQ